ncbi:hypothetical protein KO488_13380 [Poseidonibacter lekithochrous]|uniref:hypothetical protein n=1 Tax=Poseidonibacter TaxID=2321187 RepID=UPI001C089687|nr:MULTISPECIES: hypothetical protein [Poseidonibacter]MBU3015756.1 hypothetical protein [Poseidonibacter lekithochrous]MDO6829056.1 hypothetical protein [Poseidonibacter sp. 1_MG-2023]
MRITSILQYNILSLINVLIGFIVILLLGRKFGANIQTDTYFISLVIISYLSLFIDIIWSAFKQYYIEIKLKDKLLSNKMFNILFNNIIIVSILIIISYFLVTSNFEIISKEKKVFLDVFILFILIRNLINYNKVILNLEHYFTQGYVVELLINLTNLFCIIFFLNNSIVVIAYSTLLGSGIALFYQLYLIYFKLKIPYDFVFFKKEILNTIYKNSLKLNIGGMLYLTKDLLIINVLTSYGNGVYSLFSYAYKFISVILQVVNAPIFNIFVTNTTHLIAKKQYALIENNQKIIRLKLVLFYISSSIITYLILPYILENIFANKFTSREIRSIQEIFILLTITYLIVTLEGPCLTVINIFKKYNYILFTNFVFAIVMLIGFLIFRFLKLEYTEFFIFLIIAQLFNYLLYSYKNKRILKEINE